MKITIFGLAGTGTTTVAKTLATKLDLLFYSKEYPVAWLRGI